ncbi:hypothetical protein BDV93DRAFT_584916 [Ceratobasidium sp. AG-I]|nr:hypothetical protein BDV93DRAFT_584916 [Ceratobasidium sp. AG-I]
MPVMRLEGYHAVIMQPRHDRHDRCLFCNIMQISTFRHPTPGGQAKVALHSCSIIIACGSSDEYESGRNWSRYLRRRTRIRIGAYKSILNTIKDWGGEKLNLSFSPLRQPKWDQSVSLPFCEARAYHVNKTGSIYNVESGQPVGSGRPGDARSARKGGTGAPRREEDSRVGWPTPDSGQKAKQKEGGRERKTENNSRASWMMVVDASRERQRRTRALSSQGSRNLDKRLPLRPIG